MAIQTPTHVGVVKTTGGVSATNTVTSASFTPVARGLFIVAAYFVGNDGGGAATTFSVGDTFAGTGTWRQTTFGATDPGSAVYSDRISIFVADIGAAPGTGTITVTRTAGNIDQIFWADILWTTGTMESANVANVITGSDPIAGGATFTLPTAPAASSLVVGVAGFNVSSATNVVTPPSAWTEAVESFDATFAATMEVAYKNGSSVQGPAWAYTGAGGSTIYGVVIEIPAAPDPVIGDWRRLVPAWQQQRRRPGQMVSSPKPYYPATVEVSTTDVSVSAYLPIGMVPYADVTRDVSVTAHLPIGTVPYAPVSREVSLAAHLPIGAVPYAPVSKAVSLEAHLPIGVVPYTPAVLAYTVTAYLPIGVLPYAPVSKDVSLSAHLPIGVTPHAPVSKSVSLSAYLPVGVVPYAPVTRNASVVGHLSIGTVIYAVVSGATDVFVTAYLPIGVDLRAPVSRTVSVVGHLPVGTDLRAPVTRTASVAGFLPIGVNPRADVSKAVTLTAYLPVGLVIYAPAGGFGSPPVITYPTTFLVLPNSQLGIDIQPSTLTVELTSSTLVFVPDASGLLIPLTPPNEGIELT